MDSGSLTWIMVCTALVLFMTPGLALFYGGLTRTKSTLKAGVAPKALDEWAAAARTWAEGKEPPELPRVEPAAAAAKPRDVFMYFISGAKEKAPAAAMALLTRLA